MQPNSPTAILLYDDFIIILLRLVGIVHQNHRISHRLLNTSHSYIHSASHQMITPYHRIIEWVLDMRKQSY